MLAANSKQQPLVGQQESMHVVHVVTTRRPRGDVSQCMSNMACSIIRRCSPIGCLLVAISCVLVAFSCSLVAH